MANSEGSAKQKNTTAQASIFDVMEKPTEHQLVRLNKILAKLKEAEKVLKS